MQYRPALTPNENRRDVCGLGKTTHWRRPGDQVDRD